MCLCITANANEIENQADTLLAQLFGALGGEFFSSST